MLNNVIPHNKGCPWMYTVMEMRHNAGHSVFFKLNKKGQKVLINRCVFYILFTRLNLRAQTLISYFSA